MQTTAEETHLNHIILATRFLRTDLIGANVTISLCMIVKDEESYLAQALTSAKPIVDEIIIVDTGSTDQTPAIATSFGAKVFFQEWKDDFSFHRNFSIDRATGDWILVLDADECLSSSSHAKILELVRQPQNAYLFIQRHYSNDSRLSNFTPCSGEFPEWERSYGGYFESALCRLFPRRKDIRYRGRIHELVEPSLQELSDMSVVPTDIRLHHYGHTPEVKKNKNKSALYTPLGERKAEEEPNTWKAFMSSE